MNRPRALITAGFLVLTAAGAAHGASQDEEDKACRSDAIHFCSADIPNKDKITACMKQHVNELSPGCRAMFKGGGKSSGQAGKDNSSQ